MQTTYAEESADLTEDDEPTTQGLGWMGVFG